MKKSLRITLAGLMVLAMLVGCGFSPAASSEERSSASSAAETALTAASSDSMPDTTVSERDASGEYDASQAKKLSADGDLTIRNKAASSLFSTHGDGKVVVNGRMSRIKP